MSYSSTPPFDIIGVYFGVTYWQCITLSSGAVIVCYTNFDETNDPLYVAEIDTSGNTLTNIVQIMDTTDLPVGKTSYVASICETASARIGVLITAAGGGLAECGYAGVTNGGSIFTPLTWFAGVVPTLGGNRFAARIGRADTLTYEVALVWATATDLRSALIDTTGALDVAGILIDPNDPIFPIAGTFQFHDPAVVACSAGYYIVIATRYNVAGSNIYAMFCDLLFRSVINVEFVTLDETGGATWYPYDTTKIVGVVPDSTLPTLEATIYSIEQVSPTTLAVSDLGVIIPNVSWNYNSLGFAMVIPGGDVALGNNTVDIGVQDTVYAIENWQPGIVGDDYSSSAVFRTASSWGMVGRNGGQNNAAQVFGSTTPPVSTPRVISFGIAVLSCAPCVPIAPLMFDPITGEWR